MFTENGNPRRSVWQTRRGFELAKALKKHGIKIVGRTEAAKNDLGNYYDAGNRPAEIINYIMHNLTAGDRFVVLDDEDFKNGMSRFDSSFILVDWKLGLQEKDIEKALNILL